MNIGPIIIVIACSYIATLLWVATLEKASQDFLMVLLQVSVESGQPGVASSKSCVMVRDALYKETVS